MSCVRLGFRPFWPQEYNRSCQGSAAFQLALSAVCLPLLFISLCNLTYKKKRNATNLRELVGGGKLVFLFPREYNKSCQGSAAFQLALSAVCLPLLFVSLCSLTYKKKRNATNLRELGGGKLVFLFCFSFGLWLKRPSALGP